MLARTPTTWQSFREHIPNLLSFARGIAPLYLPALFWSHSPILVLSAFPVAALVCWTDWLDGYLARKWNCPSWLGAITDVISDKVLCYTLGGIGSVAWDFAWWWIVPFVPIALYDAYVLSMRAIGGIIKPSRIAKAKTCILMTALLFSVAPLSWIFLPGWIHTVGIVTLWISAGMIVWSALYYKWPKRVPDLWLPSWLCRVLGV